MPSNRPTARLADQPAPIRLIKSRLMVLGLVQQDIADALGICQSTVSAYITGRSPVPARLRQPFADILGVDPAELFAETAEAVAS